VHDSVQEYVGSCVAIARLEHSNVLEVGSRDINGSVRGFFKGPYIGIDSVDGDGVDQVMNSHALAFPDEAFDVVVCCETIEHDPAFWLTLSEIGRVLKSDGVLILTTRSNGFPDHKHPIDCWRFMADSVPLLAKLAECSVSSVLNDWQAEGLFMLARRNPRG